MGILPKFLIIAVVSFPLIMALYELFIRHFNIDRTLLLWFEAEETIAGNARPTSGRDRCLIVA